ncbi:hypothetical protein LEMLEM_LOCUS23622 [Lemmus lemmus]
MEATGKVGKGEKIETSLLDFLCVERNGNQPCRPKNFKEGSQKENREKPKSICNKMGETAQGLRAPVVLSENSSSAPSTHVGCIKITCTIRATPTSCVSKPPVTPDQHPCHVYQRRL